MMKKLTFLLLFIFCSATVMQSKFCPYTWTLLIGGGLSKVVCGAVPLESQSLCRKVIFGVTGLALMELAIDRLLIQKTIGETDSEEDQEV